MTFRRRITLFFIGVLIGIPIAVYIAKDKNVMKSPSQEIKELLLRNKLVYSKVDSCRLSCMGIDTTQLKKLINSGEVNYSKSEVHAKPCKKYTLESSLNNTNKIVMIFGLCTEETKLLSFSSTNHTDSCNCK